jgi:hypothetical protein
LALRPGRPRKHLGLKLFDPLCAACNFYFSSVISRGACAAPERAGLSQVGPEPLVPIGATQSPLLARKESICFPRHRQGHRTTPSVRPSQGRAPNRSGRVEPPISEEGKLRARNGRLNFVLSIRLPGNRKRFLTCRKSATRDPQLYFPSEGRHA